MELTGELSRRELLSLYGKFWLIRAERTTATMALRLLNEDMIADLANMICS
jgi:hypothetical protein